MLSRPLALVVLALACVVGAAAGAYLALRRSAVPDTTSPLAAPSAELGGSASAAVAETEAPVEPAPGSQVAASNPGASDSTPTTSSLGTRPVDATRRSSERQPGREVRGSSSRSRQGGPGSGDVGPSTGTLERPWPTGAARSAEPSESEPAAAATFPPGGIAVPAAPEPPPVPARQMVDVVVQSGAVIGLQLETPLSSETAKAEDRVEARVTRDVRAADRVAIPAGTLVRGSVVLVERGGKIKERARLGLRFHTLVLGDGTEVPIQAEPIYREGSSPAGESAAKIGGAAVAGAILGGILGGGRGAAVGGAVGAAGGTTAVMAGDRNPVTLPAGTALTVRLSAPVTITVEK